MLAINTVCAVFIPSLQNRQC